MNRDEVGEDPSEDEGTEIFATEGTEAFEDKSTLTCAHHSLWCTGFHSKGTVRYSILHFVI